MPLLLNKYCRAERGFCWLISSCNPWTVLLRAASICSGQRQVNIWSSWSALVSWDCQSCRSHVPLAQTNHWFAPCYRTESRGCRAPRAPWRRGQWVWIEFLSHKSDLTRCTPHQQCHSQLSGCSWTSPSLLKVFLGSFNHPRWTHNSLWRAWLIRELSQRVFNHLTEVEHTQATRSSGKGAQQQ